MRFRGTVELGGKTATGLQVPNDVIDALGGGKRPAVRITIGGHTYRTTVASRGGRFLVPLSAENRAAAGVAAGEEVEVDIQSDTASREVPVPADLAGELTRDSTAQRFFNGLSYTHRKDGCAGSKSWRDDWVTGTCFAQSDSEPTAESRAPWSSLAKASWPWRTRLLLAQGRSEATGRVAGGTAAHGWRFSPRILDSRSQANVDHLRACSQRRVPACFRRAPTPAPPERNPGACSGR